jgi:hypothetical protein
MTLTDLRSQPFKLLDFVGLGKCRGLLVAYRPNILSRYHLFHL